LSAKVKRQVRERQISRWGPGDLRCVKCLFPYPDHLIEYHHILAVSDGGEDDPDNITILCHDCHKDWHLGWDIPVNGDKELAWENFRNWLRIPSDRLKAWVFSNLSDLRVSPDLLKRTQEILTTILTEPNLSQGERIGLLLRSLGEPIRAGTETEEV
jgi:hypothetical protein